MIKCCEVFKTVGSEESGTAILIFLIRDLRVVSQTAWLPSGGLAARVSSPDHRPVRWRTNI